MNLYEQEHNRKALFQRFCRIFNISPRNELTNEDLRKVRAALDAIDDEKEETDRHVRETLNDVRMSVYP